MKKDFGCRGAMQGAGRPDRLEKKGKKAGSHLTKALFLSLSMLLVLLTVGCTEDGGLKIKQSSTYEKILETLSNLKTYKSEASVEYISNKGSNIYETLQYCKVSGEYRVEVTKPDNVSGSVTLSDGKTIAQFNPKVSGKILVGTKESPERSEIFVTSFLKNYYSSQDVSVSVGKFDDGECTVLEATIPGEHPFLRTEKLWISNKTLYPVKLVVYDPDRVERIVVTYKTFEYNILLDDTLFSRDINKNQGNVLR